jgi:serine/threonine protein kinase
VGKNTIFGPDELGSRLSHRSARSGEQSPDSRRDSRPDASPDSRRRVQGLAEVFRAIDTRTGTPCAVKRIVAVSADEEVAQTLQDFEHEGAIAKQLDHPGIARVLDFGSIDGSYFIAYELVDGVDLQFVLENASLASDPPPLEFLLYVFTRIAESLAVAHEHGVVHRDVSPANVVLSFDGDVKLIDFGIAKLRGALSRTGAGIIKGKLGYMSPEQVKGGFPEPIDHRTDVFSLGICMWELLTLKRLFSAPNEILVLDMVKHHVPGPPSALRAEGKPGQNRLEDLDRIVLKALAKTHDERYRSARQLTKDLEAFVGISGATATREDIARTMHRTFGPGYAQRSTGSIMELQETRMSDDNKSGSDLDIFEGLGKKSSGRTSAAPPPPPGSGAHVASAPPAPPAIPPAFDTKRTLMGIPGPAQPPSTGSMPAVPPSSSPSTSGLSAAPSSPNSAGRISAPPPLPSGASGASGSGSMRAASASAPPPVPSKPPPPPGRASLPNLGAQPNASSPSQSAMLAPASTAPSVTQKVQSQAPPPPPMSTRPAGAITAVSPIAPGPHASGTMPATPAPSNAPPAAAKANGSGKLDMDWDDDDEATHVFDKDKERESDPTMPAAAGPESRRPEHASMDDILSSPRPSAVPAAGTPAPPPPAATLSGAFGALGQPRESTNGHSGAPSTGFRSGPPASTSLRSAPPPPPSLGQLRPQNPSTSTAPIPPPPPPGQTTTVPMHMPPTRQQSQPPPSFQQAQQQGPHGPPSQSHQAISQSPIPMHQGQQGHQGMHSQPPQQHVSQAPMPHMPPISRAMEATSIVPRAQSSNAGLLVALLVGIVAAVGIAVFFLMPRTGTLVVNVADTKGGAVSKLEIYVDGKKACESAPCIVRDTASGVHEVKVVATGYDAPAPRAITVESRKDTSSDFVLSASTAHSGGGTGIKVSGNPLQTGVRLVIDGKEIGPLPQEVHDLTAGSHSIKVVGSERYATFEKTLDVKQDELADVGTVALKVLKGKATIQLATPGAKVYLVNGTNRKEVPQFPIAIDFDPSEKWNLEAKMFGMDDYAQPISFDDGQAEKTIVVTMSPKGTSLAANPVTTAVKAPTFTAPPPPLTPPPAVTPKATTATAAVDPPAAKDPGTSTAKNPPAAAAGGDCFLNINSRPASTVLLDGKPLGPTPRVKVPVSAGTHTVLFVNAEESLKKSVSVTVAAGETKAVSAKLRD